MLPRSASIPSPTHALSQPAHPQQVPPPPFYPDQRSFEPLEYGHRHPSHFHGHPYLQHPGQPMDILADYRTFFPYQPNEVKHRRRTTSAQLKVLEGIFKTETKPNAALRNKLAVQLEMTARGVQVWFQNRRAKEKLKASKASKAKEEKSNADKADASPPSPSNPLTGDSSSSTTTPAAEESKSDQSAATTPPTTPPSKPDSPPDSSAISPPALTINVAPSEPPSLQSPWHPPTSGGSPAQHTLPVAPVPSVDDAALLAQRRGSLPAHLHSTVDPSSDLLSVRHDPFARRRSVDASLQRLPYNPYASVARARNGMHSGLNPHRVPTQRALCPPMARAMSMDARRFSVDVVQSAQRMYSRPSPSLPYSRPSLPNGSLTSLPNGSLTSHPNGSRPSLPSGGMYAYSQRQVPPSPIPGPLPAPNFSFGAPMPPAESEQDSPRREDFDGQSQHDFDAQSRRDFDGQSLASSYATSSRFGSLASISTTDSQHTYYSDVTDPADYALRRASMSSTQFLGMMSNLDVSDSGPEQCYTGAQGGMYGAAQAQQQQQTSSEASHAAYPSPAPTLSPKDNALAEMTGHGMGPGQQHMQRAQSTMQNEQQQAYEHQQQSYEQQQQQQQTYEQPPQQPQTSCSPPDAYYPEGSLQVQYPDMYETGISPSGHYVPASYSVPAYPLDDNYMSGYTATDAGYAANDSGYGTNDANSRLEFAHPPDWGYSPVAESAPCDLGAYVRYQ